MENNGLDIKQVSESSIEDKFVPRLTIWMKKLLDWAYFLWIALTVLLFFLLLVVINSSFINPDKLKSDRKVPVAIAFHIPVEIDTQNDENTDDKSERELSILGESGTWIRGDLRNGDVAIGVTHYLIIMIIGLISLFLLRALFTNLASRKIFDGSNIALIRKLGYLSLFTAFFSPAIDYYFATILFERLKLGDVDTFLLPSYYVSENEIFFGLSLLILAQVIKEAVQMKQEQSLTI